MSALTLLDSELLTRPFGGGRWSDAVDDPRHEATLVPLHGDRAARIAAAPGDRSDAPLGGEGLTLNDVIVGAWEGLAAERPAPCPICHGTLRPRYGAGAAPVAATCADCGSELS